MFIFTKGNKKRKKKSKKYLSCSQFFSDDEEFDLPCFELFPELFTVKVVQQEQEEEDSSHEIHNFIASEESSVEELSEESPVDSHIIKILLA